MLDLLLALYGSADADTVRRGRIWYTAARDECAAVAADTGYTLPQVAAVMAITSPEAQLVTNLRWTRTACESHGAAKVGKYPNLQRPKILGALNNPDAAGTYATGPKVSAFYAAIVGDESAVVIDRWAAFAAGHDRAKVPSVKVRRLIEAAYRQAAEIVGETVAAFQAIIWIIVRSTTPRANGTVWKLADIDA